MLIRNSHCQEAWAISRPPRIGPSAGASTSAVPATLITRPISALPAACAITVCPTGSSRPPARPWSTRKTISS
jgi:hypothetical protein